MGDAANYLTENLAVKVVLFNDRPVGVEVPSTVVLSITECEPAVRGDTVNAVTKAATLETGFVVQVPMFVDQDEQIKIDTREGRYLSRVR
jgi:elongation factor P